MENVNSVEYKIEFNKQANIFNGSVQWFKISQTEFQSKDVPWQSSFWFAS